MTITDAMLNCEKHWNFSFCIGIFYACLLTTQKCTSKGQSAQKAWVGRLSVCSLSVTAAETAMPLPAPHTPLSHGQNVCAGLYNVTKQNEERELS